MIEDFRIGVRQLVTRRGSSLLAILTLALGIGATTAIFSVVDSTMLRPLPYPNPEQLVSVSVSQTRANGETSFTSPSMEDLMRLRAATEVFASVEGIGGSINGRVTGDAEPERLQVVTFTEGYLAQHGVRPLLGRDFTQADMTGSAPLVAILGYGYWQSRFGGRDVLGETIRLDDTTATIVGVMPGTFNPNTPVSLPLVLPLDRQARRGLGSTLNVVARLQPGVTPAMAAERGASYLDAAGLRVTSRLDQVTRAQRTPVNVLLGAVALVLLLAAVNVAGLLMARGATREAEVAVRASLGATRLRLIRQMLTESLALVLPGAVAGVALAWLSLDWFVANVPVFVPSNSPAAINTTVLLATLSVLAVTVLLVGLVPAVRFSRANLSGALGSGGRHTSATFSRQGGQLFIVVQVAIAVVLMTAGGLMLRSFSKLMNVDLGYSPQGLITMQVQPLEQTAGAHNEYYTSLLERARTIPGVTAAAMSDAFHMGTSVTTSAFRGQGDSEMVMVFRVSPHYFETVGATLVAGVWPTAASAQTAVRPTVINESAARLLFPDGGAVGQSLTRAGQNETMSTIVGVVADVLNDGPSGSRSFYPAHVYLPFELLPHDVTRSMTLTVRVDDDTQGVGGRLREAALGIGPRVLVERIRSGEELLAAGVTTPRRRTVMLALLGAVGLALALVGIVGVTSFAVTRRTREIGVRLAFGASPGQVIRTILRDAALPVMLGAVAGLGLAAWATRTIRSFLFETSPLDPPALVTGTILMIVAGILAAWWPARRASQVDPVQSLRIE